MNWNLARKTIGDRWKGSVIYAGGIAAYVLMVAALFPTFSKMTGAQDFFEKYPESLLRLFGAEHIDISSFNNYITMQFLSMFFVIIVGAFVISFARGMIAGELHDGTLELLMAQPIKRWKILTSKAAVLLGGIIGMVLVTVLAVFAFGAAFGIDITYSGYLAFLPLAAALFISIAGYSIFFSTVLREPRRVAMASAGLTLLLYLMHFAGITSPSLEKVGWFSIFHYYDPLHVLDSGTLPVWDILILLAVGAAFFAASLWLFKRKDVA